MIDSELINLNTSILKKYSLLYTQLMDINCPVAQASQFSTQTGTTIIASFFNNGKSLVLAGDRKITRGSPSGGIDSIAGLEAKKVYTIGKKHAFGGAGIATFIFRLGQEIPFISGRWEQDRGYPLSGYGIGGILRQFSSAITMRLGEVNGFILCSVSPHPVLFSINALHVEKQERYCFIGSGSKYARDTFDDKWEADMNKENVLDVIGDAMLQTRYDLGSGWDPNNAPIIITLEDEAEELPEKQIKELLMSRVDAKNKRQNKNLNTAEAEGGNNNV